MIPIRSVMLWAWAAGMMFAVACPGQPASPSGQASLEKSVAALLRALQSRGQLPPLDSSRREKALAGLLSGLGIQTQQPGQARASSIQEPITLNGLYAYVRVNHVGPGLAAAAEGALADIRNGHYEAVILDLRGTSGTTAKGLGESLAMFQKDPIPIVGLLGVSSGSAATDLAGHLRQKYRAILVGQSPRASLPPAEEFVLLTGDRVSLPGRGTEMPPKAVPLAPDIAVRDPQVATVTFENSAPENWTTLAARDECLRRAVDLLATMRALRQP